MKPKPKRDSYKRVAIALARRVPKRGRQPWTVIDTNADLILRARALVKKGAKRG